ncbi:MAG: rubredoxin, partial [Kiritimatiellia bacterium]
FRDFFRTRKPQHDRAYTMDKYLCEICGYIYDPEIGDPEFGIAPKTAFADLPDDWVCPDCGALADDFSIVE